jgi:hypothetical protein
MYATCLFTVGRRFDAHGIVWVWRLSKWGFSLQVNVGRHKSIPRHSHPLESKKVENETLSPRIFILGMVVRTLTQMFPESALKVEHVEGHFAK